MKFIYSFALFALCLKPSIGETAAFNLYPEECMQAFGLTQEHQWPPTTNLPIAIIPQKPYAGQTITICTLTLDYIYPQHVSVEQTGNHLVLTIFGSEIAYDPNPAVIVGTQLGTLVAGSYLVDAIITIAPPLPPGSEYPRKLITNFPLAVSAVATVPTLNTFSAALLVLFCFIVALRALQKSVPRRKGREYL